MQVPQFVACSLLFSTLLGCSENDPLPPGVSVVRVGVLPKSVVVDTSAVAQFSASADFSNGETVEIPVGWQATGGSISSAGLFTAPSTPGEIYVIATHTESGRSDTANVTVVVGTPPPSSGALFENLPAGMTLVTDNPWTGPLLPAPPGDWETLWVDPVTGASWELGPANVSAPVVIVDASAPEGVGTALALDYAGTADGFDPRGPFVSWAPSNEFALGMYVRFAPTWVQPTFSGIKWNLIRDSGGIFGWFGLGPEVLDVAGPPNLKFDFQFGACASGACPSDRRVSSTPANAGSMPTGQWHKVQYYVRKDPALLRAWVNDVLVIDKSDFSWASVSGMWRAELGGTWGGGIGYSAPEGNVVYYGRTVVLRR